MKQVTGMTGVEASPKQINGPTGEEASVLGKTPEGYRGTDAASVEDDNCPTPGKAGAGY